MKKAKRQKTMADQIGVTTRRLRQLEELGVVIRSYDGTYDVPKNAARYDVYRRRDPVDIEELQEKMTDAAREAERLIAAADPDKVDFEKVARRAAVTIKEIDESMRLLNAMRPDSDRPMLEEFRKMLVDRAEGAMIARALAYYERNTKAA